MTFEYNGLVWFQTIGLKETAVSDQSRFQANGGAVYNTPGREAFWHTWHILVPFKASAFSINN